MNLAERVRLEFDRRSRRIRLSRLLATEFSHVRYSKFIENEHPRDEDGTFVDKGLSTTAKKLLDKGYKAKPFIRTVFHGSPNGDLDTASASSQKRAFDIAPSQLGAFFALNKEEASRYAGKGGTTYMASLELHKPFVMPYDLFEYLEDGTTDGDGNPIDDPDEEEERMEELVNEARMIRKQLESQGYDGIIVLDEDGSVREFASFVDVRLDRVNSEKYAADKNLKDRLRNEFDRRSRRLKLSRLLAREFERVRYAKKFVESEHPRDADGQFTDGGGSKTSGGSWSEVTWHTTTETTKTGKSREIKSVQMPDGSQPPEHISKLRIPPAWTNVRINLDPSADLVATGFDGKGRKQAIYSANHATRQAALKFSRIRELQQKFDGIMRENSQKRAANMEASDVTMLIASTGLRPGSERDTKAEKQAHGATTLLGKHVIADASGVRLEFVGKKGVDLSIPIRDANVANMLRQRAAKSGPDGKLFAITDGQLRDYVHTLDGGNFKPKDLRTHKGTSIAAAEVRSITSTPKNEKEYKSMVRDIAIKVSTALGNTPAIALQSYIDPTVFAKLRPT